MSTRVLAAAALPGLLAICCAANAAEPAKGQVTEVVYQGIKVGIDAATGKLRPLSEEESAALDRVVMSEQAGVASRSATRRISMPSTIQAAYQTQRAISGGGSAMKMPMSEMSHVIAIRDAAGKVTAQHGDDGSAVPHAVAQPAAEEIK